MLTKFIDFFKPPEYDDIEQAQKARFLHYALFVTTGACLLLAALNLPGTTNLGLFILFVGIISFICVPINKRGYYAPVALFIAGLVLSIVTYSLLAGVGLRDAGLIAYPIFISFTSYLFSKKSVLYTTLLSMGSVVLVYFLGHDPTVIYSDESQIKVIMVLFPAAGFLLWVIVDNWEKMVRTLRETYDLTLSGWGQTLEYRDRETEGHSERVVDMTIALAKQMGLPKGKLDHIRRGALLHDIGKMAIPDAILLKKGSLSAEEWAIVKLHPVHAKKLLEDIPYLKEAMEIPYYHHERWDGSGYPTGLSKENAPLAARIFAVVDVWDALTSDRPYRRAWSEGKARDYIRDQSGKLFDPHVVEAFLEYLEGEKDDKVKKLYLA